MGFGIFGSGGEPQRPLTGDDNFLLNTLTGMQNAHGGGGANMMDVPLSKMFATFFGGDLPDIFKSDHPVGIVINTHMRGELLKGEAAQVAWAIVGSIFRRPQLPGGWAATPESFRKIIETKDKIAFWEELSTALKPAEEGNARKAMMNLLNTFASGTNENERQERNRALAAAAQQNKQPALGG